MEDAAVASRPLEPLLALVNKLQEACALAGDTVDPAHRSTLPSVWETLPQIVVVGGQSSGKSSVLEAIVGRDFLPRGAGICTRRPLVLQLHATSPAPEAAEGFPPASPGGSETLKPRSSSSAASRGDTARFLHKPDVVFDDFSKVRDEIEAETARALGPGKAVSSEPIMLSIRSAHVPNLTLVDMPGLTKVATADQPASIVRDIEDMARAFVAPPNVVIVAVSPANADIATSDGVRIAREVDPGFRRTIGVLTKLDLMDAGTDARDVLEQRALRLRLGWCAVVNRSQADIANRVSMRDAREREAAFFRTNAALYSHVNTGTDTLTRMLASVLGAAVRRQIPRIVDAVDRRTDAALAESRALGKAMPSDRGALVHEVLRACDAFEKRFAEALDSGVGGGESVRRIFEEKLRAALASANLRELYDARNVRAVIDASDGVQPHLVAPEMGIRRLIELGLETMHEPVARCVRAVDRVLRSMVERALDDGDGSTGGAAAAKPKGGGGAADALGSRRLFANLGANGRTRTMSGAFRADGGDADGSARAAATDGVAALRRFPALRRAVARAASGTLDALVLDAEAMVAALVDMEAAYFDADFFRRLGVSEAAKDAAAEATREAENGGGGERRERKGGEGAGRAAAAAAAAAAAPTFNAPVNLLDADVDPLLVGEASAMDRDVGSDQQRHLRAIAGSVYAYVDAVRARMAKAAPKAVAHCLVRKARGGLLGPFYASLGELSEEDVRALVEEDAGVSNRRRACEARLGMLRRARAEIAAALG